MYIDCDHITRIHHQVTVTYSQHLGSCGTVADDPGHGLVPTGNKKLIPPYDKCHIYDRKYMLKNSSGIAVQLSMLKLKNPNYVTDPNRYEITV